MHIILHTAIRTKFAPTYVCIFMNEIDTSFLGTQESKPLVWFLHIDDVFFIWTHGNFLIAVTIITPIFNLIMSLIKETFIFWILRC